MKQLSATTRIVAILLIGIVAGFVFDLLTTPPTTADMTQAAAAHIAKTQKETPPIPFYQDGCSLFPDRLPGHDFRAACLTHDIAYWAGGSQAERKAADLALRSEISHTGILGPLLAPIVYTGVRLFGDTWLTKAVGANWGYGWNE